MAVSQEAPSVNVHLVNGPLQLQGLLVSAQRVCSLSVGLIALYSHLSA